MPPIIKVTSSEKILTVSQLNQQSRLLLESHFKSLQVEGEVSNCVRPSSGHYYFTLKDRNAQVRCAFFKTRHLSNQIKLEDGMQIIVTARVSIYEPRGDYQLIVENIEPAGLGLLQKQFEELKKKLAGLGLFEQQHKQQLPLFPKQIGVITSPTGAAIRDILTTLKRRFPAIPVVIYPTEVQGANAAKSIRKALSLATQKPQVDVLIMARGGGSIEDLWAFNDEQLAHDIFASPIPIVTGIGHEIDFTIADFVADLRAATPTAAAESVTPDGPELIRELQKIENHLSNLMIKKLEHAQLLLSHMMKRLSSPEHLILRHTQLLDKLELQLKQIIKSVVQQKIQQLRLLQARLINPVKKLEQYQQSLNVLKHRLINAGSNKLNTLKQQLMIGVRTLRAVSPLATLERGYSIALHDKKVINSIDEVAIDEHIEIRLTDGQLQCQVNNKEKFDDE